MTTTVEPVRGSLRASLRSELSNRIASGRFAPGARLNESDIARELGVSQTPVREALLSLEGDVGITAEPRRGFRVLPLTTSEAIELSTLIGRLERFGLQSQPVPSKATLSDLAELNAHLSRKSLPGEEALSMDRSFHELLLSGTPAGHLTGTLSRLRQQLRRYQVALLRDSGSAAVATASHRDILDALRGGRVKRAAKLLEQHWLAGIGPMRDWLGADAVGTSDRVRPHS